MKSATWHPTYVREPVVPRSCSLPNLMSHWTCSHCQLESSSVSSRCAACGLDTMATDTQQPWSVPSINILQEEKKNRSPKRQNPSVYERVKSKVSRSLSNGSGVVHRRWTENKCRPTSLIVESNSVTWNVNNIGEKNSWSCLRCTLVNHNQIDRCAVCEMPRKSNILGTFSTLPKSGVVITIPDWCSESVDAQAPVVKDLVASGTQETVSSLCDSLWTKPIYRRSISDVLPADSPLVDIKANRRSLVETDAQGNLQQTPPGRVNNLNLKLTPITDTRLSMNTTKYSYIGISEPAVQHSKSPQSIVAGKCVSSGPVLDLTERKVLIADSLGTKSLQRMWTCIKCSYAYNPIWSRTCDICNSVRTAPSLTEPSLITVTKDSVRYSLPKEEGGLANGPENHLQQELEEDFQYVPSESAEDWTCKKCTLVNSGSEMACVVCGGSKLRSISLFRDMTLRKGEFWSCPQCTLKNPFSSLSCQVCKTANKPPRLLEVPTSKHAPRSPSPRHGQKPKSNPNPALGAIPKQRQIRKIGPRNSPQVRHSKSGVISGYSNGPVTNELAVISAQVGARSPSSSWHCVHCTFENRTSSVACEMCQSSRNLSSSASPVPPGTPVPPSPSLPETAPAKIQTIRQESELMEDLRHIEEREALGKLKRIVQYCKEVSTLTVLYTCLSTTFNKVHVISIV